MYGSMINPMMPGLGYGAGSMNPMMMGMGMPGFGLNMNPMFGGLNGMMGMQGSTGLNGMNNQQKDQDGSQKGGIFSGLMNAMMSFANLAMYKSQMNMMMAQQEASFKQTWGSAGAMKV